MKESFLASKSLLDKKAKQDIEKRGYQPLDFSAQMGSASKTSYHSLVFINKQTKSILIANSGLKVSSISSAVSRVKDAVKVRSGMKFIPENFDEISNLNQRIIEELARSGENIEEYNFEYSGHYMGAMISRLQALDMGTKVKRFQEGKGISAVLFDCPNYAQAAEKLVPDKTEREALFTSQKILILQERPNLLNSFLEKDRFLSKKEEIYEIFNFSKAKKSNFLVRISKKIGFGLWKNVKKHLGKAIKEFGPFLTGAAVGAAVGSVIPGAGTLLGAGVGLVVASAMSKEAEKQINKFMQSERVQTIIQSGSDILESIENSAKSYNLDNFNGDLVMLKLQDPSSNEQIKKLGISGARFLEYNEKIYNKLQDRDDVISVDEVAVGDLEELRNYSIFEKKYFMKYDGKLLRFSREVLKEIVIEVHQESKNDVEKSQKPIQALEDMEIDWVAKKRATKLRPKKRKHGHDEQVHPPQKGQLPPPKKRKLSPRSITKASLKGRKASWRAKAARISDMGHSPSL